MPTLSEQLTRPQKVAIYNWLKQDISWIDLFCQIQPLLPDDKTKVRLLHVADLFDPQPVPKEFTLREAVAIGGTFVSHKWFPVDLSQERDLIKTEIVTRLTGHIWVDHFSCDQQDPVKDIICAVSLLRFFKFEMVEGPGLDHYMNSMWCLTEYLVSDPDEVKITEKIEGSEARRIIERSRKLFDKQREFDLSLSHEPSNEEAIKLELKFIENAYLITLCLIFCFEGNINKFIMSMSKRLSTRRSEAYLTCLLYSIRKDLGFIEKTYNPESILVKREVEKPRYPFMISALNLFHPILSLLGITKRMNEEKIADDKGKTADDKGKTADDKGKTADKPKVSFPNQPLGSETLYLNRRRMRSNIDGWDGCSPAGTRVTNRYLADYAPLLRSPRSPPRSPPSSLLMSDQEVKDEGLRENNFFV